MNDLFAENFTTALSFFGISKPAETSVIEQGKWITFPINEHYCGTIKKRSYLVDDFYKVNTTEDVNSTIDYNLAVDSMITMLTTNNATPSTPFPQLYFLEITHKKENEGLQELTDFLESFQKHAAAHSLVNTGGTIKEGTTNTITLYIYEKNKVANTKRDN